MSASGTVVAEVRNSVTAITWTILPAPGNPQICAQVEAPSHRPSVTIAELLTADRSAAHHALHAIALTLADYVSALVSP